MSDYLGRLVARSLGLAEVIRPRPAGLFETVPRAAEAAPIPAAEAPAEFRSPPMAPPREIRKPSAAPSATTRPRREAPAAAPTKDIAAVHAVTPGPSHRPSAVAGNAATMELRAVIPAPTRTSAQPAVPASDKPVRASPIDRPPTEVRRSPSPSVAMVPAKAGPETASAELAQGRTASPRVPRAVQSPAPPRPRIVPSPPAEILPARRPSIAVPTGIAAFRGATPGRDQAASDRAESPATIQVTIGRVEVRASVAAAPPRRRAAAAATMSLEDYLRERAGRGGRA